jgi:hypothetical protein
MYGSFVLGTELPAVIQRVQGNDGASSPWTVLSLVLWRLLGEDAASSSNDESCRKFRRLSSLDGVVPGLTASSRRRRRLVVK